MKINFDRQCLLQILQRCSVVAPRHSPKPILTNVFIEAIDGAVRFLATDLETGMTATMRSGIQIESGGNVVAPLARLLSICNETSASMISLETQDNGSMKIKADRSRFVLPTENPDEYPRMKHVTGEGFLVVSGGDLRRLIRHTVGSIDAASTRYALGGVRFEVHGTSLVAVATDGRRLSTDICETVDNGGGEQKGAVVPAKACALIERCIGNAPENVKVHIGLNEVAVRTTESDIYSRVIEGRFPPWEQVFPAWKAPERFAVHAGVLHAALRQSAIVTDAESRGVVFQFEGSKLKLFAETAEIGDSEVDLPIEANISSKIEVVLDVRYVSDFCKMVPADALISGELESATSPLVMRAGESHRYVVMPMSKN